MNEKDKKYFKVILTMLRRVRTMLRRIAERTDVIDISEKANYAADNLENAISMMEIIDHQYVEEKKACKQLSIFEEEL